MSFVLNLTLIAVWICVAVATFTPVDRDALLEGIETCVRQSTNQAWVHGCPSFEAATPKPGQGNGTNGLIQEWNVSLVTNTWAAFSGYKRGDRGWYFNINITAWDVSSVTSMYAMFLAAKKFNPPKLSWDVSSVRSMEQMFKDAFSFNSDITFWDVSSVGSMQQMFSKAYQFNRDLSAWDVSSVRRMDSMFSDANKFSQDLSSWDVSRVGSFKSMFSCYEREHQGKSCSRRYNLKLCGATWVDNSNIPPLTSDSTKYCKSCATALYISNERCPQCSTTDGSAVNTDTCACGDTDCTSGTGLFCDTSKEGRCSSVPTCSNKDGTDANKADCACGNSECNAATGRFCNVASNKCNEFGPSPNDGGSGSDNNEDSDNDNADSSPNDGGSDNKINNDKNTDNDSTGQTRKNNPSKTSESLDEIGSGDVSPDEGMSGGAIAAAVIVPLLVIGAIGGSVYFMRHKTQEKAHKRQEKATLDTEMVLQKVAFQVTNPEKETSNHPADDGIFTDPASGQQYRVSVTGESKWLEPVAVDVGAETALPSVAFQVTNPEKETSNRPADDDIFTDPESGRQYRVSVTGESKWLEPVAVAMGAETALQPHH